jgi:hypothetical protein
VDFAPVMGPAKYGIDPAAPASNAPTALASTVTPSEQGQAAAKLLSPHNPLFAFGALAAVTFGLMAFSTSVRVGHTSASLNLGETS